MPITDKQLQQRSKYIGSSDAPVILGMSTFKSAVDVWIEKIYPLEPLKPTKDMKRGNYLEPCLLKYAADETGYKLAQNQFRVNGIFGAHLDGQAYKAGGSGKSFLPIGFEAKSSRITDGWGDPGTDDVPLCVFIQVLHQMYAAKLQTVFIPRIAPFSLDLQLYRIDRTPEIEDTINDLVIVLQNWWDKHVKGNTRPDNQTPPQYEIVRRIKRVPGTFAESINEEIIKRWETAKINKYLWTKNEEEIKSQILLSMGQNEGCKLTDGRYLTFMPDKGGKKVLRIKKG